jgi:hypothetical protein
MNETNAPIIYQTLLERHGQIRIPMLQRDYAQGRDDQEEVRERFLDALQEALELPDDDPRLPLNLDFIYGSVEESRGETSFYPLDGQQRLTTLFLMHWYLAWKDDRWGEFQKLFLREDGNARFAYSVRTTSSEFFNKLVAHHPSDTPEQVPNLTAWITDQPWYFRYWRFDPTIVSALNMLEALHKRFAQSEGLYGRLTDAQRPAITFQLLDFKHFGLSDDLYIKMNARGKPLTEFETFKARYEQQLKAQFVGKTRKIGVQPFDIAEFVARRMDTAWGDFFWDLRQDDSPVFDDAVMNVFRAVALVSRDPSNQTFLKDVATLRGSGSSASYSVFNSRNWLDEAFTSQLISLLESWSSTKGFSSSLLPSARYFDEKAIFLKLAGDSGSLTAPEIVQFTAYALFIQEHESGIDPVAFQEWMRVIHNLALNSDIDRTDRLQQPAKSLRELLPHATDILQYLSKFGDEKKIAGFSERQVREEILKAGLILADDAWRPLIERAEKHGYFRGQIMFLCEFSGIAAERDSSGSFDWKPETHAKLQATFNDYLSKAETMFDAKGLKPIGDSRWQRALLTVGDYLLKNGPNWSFLVNSQTESDGWKRFLGGTLTVHSDKRKLLQSLWDSLDATRPYVEQLEKIIANAKDLDPWIEALVRTPRPIGYCGGNMIRWNTKEEIYLLSKKRMHASHAELFTYALYHETLRALDADGALKPLKLSLYHSVNGIDEEPYVPLDFKLGEQLIRFRIGFTSGRYTIESFRGSWDELSDLRDLLCASGGFTAGTCTLTKTTTRDSIKTALIDLAQLLSQLSPQLP